ncbi:MAG TPA: copper resistance CopC family protein [Steroidobacteraceae bacterium]|nr:copper resistance CopC family protein [Steroidobacteraceae bacterium]
MKPIALCTAVALLFSVTAYGHSHLEKSTPAEGSVLTTAPANFVLNFEHPVRVTALSIQKGDGQSEPVGPVPETTGTQISVPAPKLVPGKYTVSWRAVSSDKHVMSGKIQFTLAPAS